MKEEYKQMILNGEFSLIIQTENFLYTFNGSGIKPLYDNKAKLSTAKVYDKAIGTAAAVILSAAKAEKVFTPIITKRAVDILKQSGIKVEYLQKVDYILNKKKDGLCPLEKRFSDQPSLDIKIIEDFLADIDKLSRSN